MKPVISPAYNSRVALVIAVPGVEDITRFLPYCRYFRHFYPPQKGHLGYKCKFSNAKFWATSDFEQKEWADELRTILIATHVNQDMIDLVEQINFTSEDIERYIDDFSWSKARSFDLQNNSERKKAFISLGHILHLLQDMTVPAHVRDDAHVSPFHAHGIEIFSTYEHYMKNDGSFIDPFSQKSVIEGKDIAEFGNIYKYLDALAEYNSKFFNAVLIPLIRIPVRLELCHGYRYCCWIIDKKTSRNWSSILLYKHTRSKVHLFAILRPNIRALYWN